ncbi:unnamed protein product, partial [Trichogramma brassicae]
MWKPRLVDGRMMAPEARTTLTRCKFFTFRSTQKWRFQGEHIQRFLEPDGSAFASELKTEQSGCFGHSHEALGLQRNRKSSRPLEQMSKTKLFNRAEIKNALTTTTVVVTTIACLAISNVAPAEDDCIDVSTFAIFHLKGTWARSERESSAAVLPTTLARSTARSAGARIAVSQIIVDRSVTLDKSVKATFPLSSGAHAGITTMCFCISPFNLISTDKIFELWKFQIKAVLVAHDLLEIIEGTETKPEPGEDKANATKVKEWTKKDAKAMFALSSSIDYSQLDYLVNCASANEKWKKLSNIHEQKSTSNKLALTTKFHEYRKSPNDSIAQHLRGYVQGQIQ